MRLNLYRCSKENFSKKVNAIVEEQESFCIYILVPKKEAGYIEDAPVPDENVMRKQLSSALSPEVNFSWFPVVEKRCCVFSASYSARAIPALQNVVRQHSENNNSKEVLFIYPNNQLGKLADSFLKHSEINLISSFLSDYSTGREALISTHSNYPKKCCCIL